MKTTAKILLLLTLLCFVGMGATAYGESSVEYRIDSLDIVESSLGTYHDLFTIPVVDGYFPVYLSGWQIASNTEYTYLPQASALTNGNDDIMLNSKIWIESFDDNPSPSKRISLLLYLKKEAYDDSAKILEAVNQLVFEITVAQLKNDTSYESQHFSVKTQPQIDRIRDSSNITVNLKLFDELDYLQKPEENHNIIHYANLIRSEAQAADVVCWEMECQMTAPWPIKCMLGYHNEIPTSYISYFNSYESLVAWGAETMYFLIGYNERKPSRDEVISIFEELNPQLFISPEPCLIGNYIGGPYYQIAPKLESEE